MFPLSPRRVMFALSRTSYQILTMNESVNHTSLKDREITAPDTRHDGQRLLETAISSRNPCSLSFTVMQSYYSPTSDIYFLLPLFLSFFFLSFFFKLSRTSSPHSKVTFREEVAFWNPRNQRTRVLHPSPPPRKAGEEIFNFFPFPGARIALGNFIGRRHARPPRVRQVKFDTAIIAAIHFPFPAVGTFPYSPTRTRSFPVSIFFSRLFRTRTRGS